MKKLLLLFFFLCIQYSAITQILDASDFEVRDTESRHTKSEIIFKDKSVSFFSSSKPSEVIGGYYDSEKCFVLFKSGAVLFFQEAVFYDNEWHSYSRSPQALNYDISGMWQIQLIDIKILNDESFSYNQICVGMCDHLINNTFFEEGIFYAKIVRPTDRLMPQTKALMNTPSLKIYSEALYNIIEWF